MFQAELDALSVECIGVGLNLHVLLQKAVNRFLGFMQLYGKAGVSMELELLLYGFSQIPAEKYKRFLTMAFGV